AARVGGLPTGPGPAAPAAASVRIVDLSLQVLDRALDLIGPALVLEDHAPHLAVLARDVTLCGTASRGERRDDEESSRAAHHWPSTTPCTRRLRAQHASVSS